MATTINAATTGLVETSDGTAVLALQTGGTTAVTINATQALGVGSSPSYGTAGQFLTSGGSGASPTWTSGGSGTVTSVGWTGGIVSIASATTTPAFTIAGTSGGIPYFSNASTWASSGALTQYGVVYGGGAGGAPVATAAGTTGQFLGANTSGAPTWQTPAASSGPTFFAYLSANQTPVSAGTFTKVALNTTNWDTASAFNTSTNRFQPTTSGYYTISISADLSTTTNITDGIISIYKNGSQYVRPVRNTLSGTGVPSTVAYPELLLNGSTIVFLNGSTDYVELYVYIQGTGTLSVGGGAAYTWMTGSFIRS